MKRLDFGNVAASMSFLGGALKMMQINRTHILRGEVAHQIIDIQTYARMVHAIKAIGDAAETMEMTATKAACRRAEQTLIETFQAHGHFGPEALSRIIDPVHQTIAVFRDELDGRLVIALPAQHAALFDPTEPVFGEQVDSAFPLASEDLGEAANCLALGRPTACVFHLMRAMEYAVQRLSDRLGIANTTREWGKLLSDIAKAIEAMPRGENRNS